MSERDEIRRHDSENKFRPQSKLDRQLEAEIEAALGDASLSELMEEAEATAPRPVRQAGSSIQRGEVIDIQGDDIFIEMGGKRQGLLPAGQFADEPLPEIGQSVEFVVEGVDDKEGLLILSRQGAVLRATWDNLEVGTIVEGRVTGHNKGGLELTVNGIEAFMPISQIERFRVDDISGYVGQKFRCMVSEIDRREEKLILSRRDVLDADAEAQAADVLASLEPGQTVSGVVKTIMPYGAFVDIGGIDGLVHISDLSYARVEKAEDVVSPGQQVEVVVLEIDREAGKISLGLKQAKGDPWTDVANKYPMDELVTGRVVRMEGFGAFVELEPGVDALIPISEMSFAKRVHHPREIVSEGEVVKARVISVDPAARRIALSLKRAGDDPWMGAQVRWAEGSTVTGPVTRIAAFGAFVEVAPGVEGLVHISELGQGFVRSVSEAVREGEVVSAKVISVDEAARRMSLSIKQLAESPDYTGPEDAPRGEAPRPEKKRKRPLRGGLG